MNGFPPSPCFSTIAPTGGFAGQRFRTPRVRLLALACMLTRAVLRFWGPARGATLWPVPLLLCSGFLSQALFAQDVAPSGVSNENSPVKTSESPSGNKTTGKTPLVEPSAGTGSDAAGAKLALRQAQLAEKFRRLEAVFLRRAELTAAEDPDRAELLRQAYARCREKALAASFDEIKGLLAQDQVKAYADALAKQNALEKDLLALLQLLMSEDRGQRIQEEQAEIKELMQRLNKVMRMQQSIRARTERGSGLDDLAPKQSKLEEETGKIAGDVAKREEKNNKESGRAKEDKAREGEKENAGDKTEEKDAEQSSGKDGGIKNQDDPSGNSQENGSPSDKSSEGKGQPKPEEGKPSNPGSKGEGQSDKPSGESNPSQGNEGQSGGASDGRSSESEKSPTQQRLEEARRRMKAAEEALKQAQQEKAAESQKKAEASLDQAIAELEKILRQLREEEMQRTLAQLEARFRRMLSQQTEVYESTKRLDKTPVEARGRDTEAAAARLSKNEQEIALEATRALTLLREDGTSVAFPETVEQMRDDMVEISRLLAQTKIGALTWSLEEDVMRTLEELIGAVERAQKDLEEKKKDQQPPPRQQDQQEREDPLLDKIAELKMIRSLQVRINRRTEELSTEAARTEASEDLLKALQVLAERQQKLFRAARDLVLEKNQ